MKGHWTLRSPGVRERWITTLACAVASLVAAASASADPGCANQALRTGPSANLPDCRAYEKVSPADKGSVDIPTVARIRSSADGNGVVYTAYGAFAGATSASANNYLARRGVEGWATKSIDPPLTVASLLGNENSFRAFNQDLTKGVLRHFVPPSIAPGDDPQHWSVYLRDNVLDSYETATPPQQTETFSPPSVEDATADLSYFAMDTPAANTYVPGGPERAAYIWSKQGGFSLVSLEPGTSTPFPSAGVGSGTGYAENAISEDGSRLFFTTPSGSSPGEPNEAAQLYVREDQGGIGAESVRVSAPEAGVVDPSGTQSAWFRFASEDGSRVFFTSKQKLTGDATADSGAGSADLYRYDLSTGVLTDLTAASPSGGGVLGLAGASDDGSVIYLVATGVLAAGAVPGEPNLYAWQAGSGFQFVATLSGEDEKIWGLGNAFARATPNGSHLAFATRLPLDPGFDNVDPVTSSPHREVYLYSLGSGALRCASCHGAGPATADAGLAPLNLGFYTEVNEPLAFARQNLTSTGDKLFFESGESLVGADRNGVTDVYEFDSAAGSVALVSTGAGNSPATFAGASPSGDDVFIVTRQRLTAGDTDTLGDLYDARVGGGIAEPANGPAPCAGDSCQGLPSSAPTPAAEGSATLSGPPNAKVHRAKGKRCRPSRHSPNSTKSQKKAQKPRCARKKHGPQSKSNSRNG